jgi:hypothetical protein
MNRGKKSMEPQMPPTSSEDVTEPALLPDHPHPSRFNGSRKQTFDRRSFSWLFLAIGCCLGLVVGVAGALLVLTSGESEPVPTVQAIPGQPAIVVTIGSTYISQLAQKEVQNVQVPGKLQNIRVTLKKHSPMLLNGDDQLSILGAQLTRTFSVEVVPYAQACRLQFHVNSVKIGQTSMPSLASSLEQQLDQQIQLNSSTLPRGFAYCVQEVHTEDNALVMSYIAEPL